MALSKGGCFLIYEHIYTFKKKSHQILGNKMTGYSKSFRHVFYAYRVGLSQFITPKNYIALTNSQLPSLQVFIDSMASI